MKESALHWYALKVFYNKVFDIEDCLFSLGIPTYLAVDKVQLKGEVHLAARKRIASLQAEGKQDRRYIHEGAIIYQRVLMVNSLIFAQADDQSLPYIEKALLNDLGEARGFIYRRADWKKGYAIIPEAQMASFKLITTKGSQGLEFFSADDISRFKEGKKVRVTEGPLRGAEGYIKRIRRDRRLLVCIEGVVAVATAFIEPQFLEEVQE